MSLAFPETDKEITSAKELNPSTFDENAYLEELNKSRSKEKSMQNVPHNCKQTRTMYGYA